MKKIFAVILACQICLISVITGYCETAPATDEVSTPGEILFTANTDVSLNINAKAYLLMDTNTGTVIAASNENVKLYPASVTKIMSLLLVCDAIDRGELSLDETVVCSETAAAKGGSQIWLEPGEEMTVRELLKATFVYSANDACTLLSERVAGNEEVFVQKMNEKAKELGMENTHFDNCTGLDDDTTTHLTTAYDIAIMSRELLKKKYISDYTMIWMDTLRNGATQIVNTNKLVRYYEGITGLKTGTTSKAGCCVSASAERNGLGLIAVILGADNSKERFNGAKTLLDYGFANYEIFTPSVDEENLEDVSVLRGTAKSVEIETTDISDILVNKGKSAEITEKVTISESAEAPVSKGQKLGEVKFFIGENEVVSISLTAKSDVEKLTVSKAFFILMKSLNNIQTQ